MPRLESRFVEEIPADALEERCSARRRADDLRAARSFAAEDESQEVDLPGTGELRRGRRVRHPRYGYGVILRRRARATRPA